MTMRRARLVLWLYVASHVALGLLFLIVPTTAAGLFPWPLPPLAARFMGSLFLAGAACGAVNIRLGEGRGLTVLALVAIGNLLIVATGILAVDTSGITTGMALWLAWFVGVAIALLAVAFLSVPGLADVPIPMPRSLRRYFRIHLAIVLPVGVAMFLFPVWAQPIWPWAMAPVNIRLLGAFFAGAALISFWGQRQASWHTVLPTLALYAVFATAATVASLIHFGLFEPSRLITWVFFALYVFVASGGWYFLTRYSGQA
jgi:hypothetical protein